MNRGEAAEYAKRLRADIRTQRMALVRDMPELRDLARLSIDCRALCQLAEDSAENDSSGQNRRLLRTVAERALVLAHLYAQLERTLEELSGVPPGPRQRRLYDEFERRQRQVLSKSREFEIILDGLIQWATGDVV